MHVLRKLTSCLSSTTGNSDECPKQEEHISSATNILSRLSSIEDITVTTTITNKGNSILEPRNIRQTILMNER
jgi:hypothetical protein